jgi:hypothetical protein
MHERGGGEATAVADVPGLHLYPGTADAGRTRTEALA